MRPSGQTRATRMNIYEHLSFILRVSFQRLPVSVTVQVEDYINIGVDVFDYILEYRHQPADCAGANSVLGSECAARW